VSLSLYLLWFLLFGQAADSPEAALQRLRSRVAVAPLTGTGESIAGKYVNPPKEWTARWGGGLSGEDLHLFPDGTYIYCEWADVQPLTVYDKGVWRMSGLTIELTSDPEVTWGQSGWGSRLERRYLLLQRAGRKHDALLIGLGRALSSFESESKDDPDMMLLIAGLLRAEAYGQRKATKVKAQLMEYAWRPESFKSAR
jgi:hypothetical protein